MRLSLAVLIAGLVAASLGAAAHDLAKPRGPVILQVAGAIEHRNDGTAALFDLAMLEALEQATFSTSTPWTDGIVEFEGASVEALLDEVGASGDKIIASALDDYAAAIPIAALIERGAMIAYRMNGAPLPARFAPLWIVFPYDTDPAALTEQPFQSYSVWALKKIVAH